MKTPLFVLICMISFSVFSQETEVTEEFLPINLEGKEAFLSTKTGEYIFLDHADTDARKLKTTDSGVIYTDIKIHTVAKRETISRIAKKYDLSEDELIQQNDLKNTKLSIGQELKVIKNLVIKSSSPVLSQGESRIIAQLQPGQSPTSLEVAPPQKVVSTPNKPSVTETKEVVQREVVQKEEEKTSTTDSGNYYIVKKGESLYSIAKEHNTTIEAIMELNKLTSSNIGIGQKLLLK
ncbi:LysM peptidoglycan-binding domain-containing protein [Oceanihabitans sediminis]|uniref:LysM peptidoglycan-binding domain-containing protein n=1 Tax=Oceanihabitans sediminis TaxID=1812012 RepID=A0A368P1V0_9FLAO|nr:LysM peptidoglycan-binding domain-containing protein [Oceanihabitans sediminis]MDX1277717.1 LysM peptidoglycan-binding domain-containing protein [Oceanihabitans sediminis]RBP27719.1 LysM repeat protein [Oceanihabitans sediminis]RCU56508.1 LysM peptidoglycan-binding domain-containing protein [Oceanihabitans sediminis]